jgi:hypothetical protein
MDSYEGPATLEWWANRSTCLGSVAVHVAVCVTGNEWTCEASFSSPLGEDEREGFDFLMALDPVFTLRFQEDSTLVVNVAETTRGRLTLTAYAPPADEPRTPRSQA